MRPSSSPDRNNGSSTEAASQTIDTAIRNAEELEPVSHIQSRGDNGAAVGRVTVLIVALLLAGDGLQLCPGGGILVVGHAR